MYGYNAPTHPSRISERFALSRAASEVRRDFGSDNPRVIQIPTIPETRCAIPGQPTELEIHYWEAWWVLNPGREFAGPGVEFVGSTINRAAEPAEEQDGMYLIQARQAADIPSNVLIDVMNKRGYLCITAESAKDAIKEELDKIDESKPRDARVIDIT